jgi:hypothetical protein
MRKKKRNEKEEVALGADERNVTKQILISKKKITLRSEQPLYGLCHVRDDKFVCSSYYF